MNERSRKTDTDLNPLAHLVLNGQVADDLRGTLATLEQQGIPFVPALITPDPNGGKADKKPTPTIRSWKQYWGKPASPSMVQAWIDGGLFEGKQKKGGYGGVGIILSEYSRMICVDLDTPDAIAAYTSAFPDVPPTYSESTVSGGKHIFYRIPHDTPYPQKRSVAAFGDFLANHYCVIAPTPGYSIIGGGWNEICTLNSAEFSRVMGFFSPTEGDTTQDAESVLQTEFSHNFGTLDSAALARQFERLVPIMGSRNDALHRAARVACDHGISIEDCKAVLVTLYVVTPHASKQTNETSENRKREAIKTIESAYRCRPRKQQDAADTPRQLPNRIREALLQAKFGNVARLIDALLQQNTNPGDLLTHEQIVTRLSIYKTADEKPMFTPKSLYRILDTTYQTADKRTMRIFSQKFPVAIAFVCCDENVNSLREESAQDDFFSEISASHERKQEKKRGRPLAIYRIPTFIELADLLNIDRVSQIATSGYLFDPLYASDTLPATAFASLPAYRRAITAAQIERAPGAYTRAALAARVGVTKRTSQSDTMREGIETIPQFETIAILTKENIRLFATYDRRDSKSALPGAFMEDERGRRYALELYRALELLKRGHTLTLSQRTANFYRMPDKSEPAAPKPGTASQKRKQP